MSDLYLENSALLTTDAWDGEGGAPDPGDYLVTVAKIERKRSSKKSLSMLEVQYEILANADGSESPMRGRKAFARYMEEGKGIGRLRAFLDATGVEINARGGYDPEAAIGAQLFIGVFKKPYPGLDDNGEEVMKMGTEVAKERPFEAAAGAQDDDDYEAADDTAEDDDYEAAADEEEEEEAPPARRAPARAAASSNGRNGNGARNGNGNGKAAKASPAKAAPVKAPARAPQRQARR